MDLPARKICTIERGIQQPEDRLVLGAQRLPPLHRQAGVERGLKTPGEDRAGDSRPQREQALGFQVVDGVAGKGRPDRPARRRRKRRDEKKCGEGAAEEGAGSHLLRPLAPAQRAEQE